MGEAFTPSNETFQEKYENGKMVWREKKKIDTQSVNITFNIINENMNSLSEFKDKLVNRMGDKSLNPKYWNQEQCIEFLKTQDLGQY